MIFTNRFKWHRQVSGVIKTASKRLYIIRCLKEVVTTRELVNIYHSLITSIFMYASPVYGRLPAKLLSKFERFQKRAHRLICGPSCDCDGFPMLSLKLENAAVELLLRSEASVQHPLNSFVPHRLPASRRLRLPTCVTTRRLNSFFPWASQLYNSLF